MDKKEKFKAGLQFGIGMTLFFIIQNLWMAEELTWRTVAVSILTGLLSGSISGALFGWVIGAFANSSFVERATRIDLQKEEQIIFQTGANHFKGLEGVGGKLYLTNKRLVFKSHRLNLQRHQLSIELDQIRSMNRYNTLGVLANGLSLTTATGTEKFVVQKSDQWAVHLKDMLSSTPVQQ